MDVPLPLVGPAGGTVTGVTTAEGALVRVPAPPRLQAAIDELGLSHALGYLRLLQVHPLRTRHCTSTTPFLSSLPERVAVACSQDIHCVCEVAPPPVNLPLHVAGARGCWAATSKSACCSGQRHVA